jgi:hypothetical protein
MFFCHADHFEEDFIGVAMRRSRYERSRGKGKALCLNSAFLFLSAYNESFFNGENMRQRVFAEVNCSKNFA